jgi:hypothetical protein
MQDVIELDGIALDMRQKLAYEEWQRLSTGGQTPLQQEFRPDRIARALPAATLMHVERGARGQRFRQRLEGRFATLAFGEGSGDSIEDIYTDAHLFDIMPRYLESATTGDPAMATSTVQTREGDSFTYTRLILPFAGTDGRVNRLFVVFSFDAAALARLSGPVDVRRNKPPAPRKAEIQPAASVRDALPRKTG